jgi:hypothetical protein
MKDKTSRCVVTAAVSEKERKFFATMACDLDVSCNVLMRRLIRYLLNGKISWGELFSPIKELPTANEADATRKSYLRTHLTYEQYTAFTQIADEWGSTVAIVMRRLVLRYIAGEIDRRDIW